jgi:endonuclease/exonuclease/phosphatase family metal-dependent hydrolase
MKYNQKFVILSFLAFIMSSAFAQSDAHLNVMTFNIRYDNPEDAEHNWQHRKVAAAELILSRDADLIGTQEVLKNQLDDLLLHLPGYVHIGVGRSDGIDEGEFSAILIKKERFEIIESGTFWLSETPDVVGSVGWDAAMERIASWAILLDKKTNKQLKFVNTHYDHRGKKARKESSKLLLDKIAEKGYIMPVILTGDFNSIPESEAIQHILQSKMFFDAAALSPKITGPEWTFHGFGKTPEKRRRRIDFVFYNASFEVMEYNNIFEKTGNTFHSDHTPIHVQFTYK